MDHPWPAEFEAQLRPHCRLLGESEALDPGAPLPELGVDSLAVVELIVQLEDAFEVSFPDEALTPEVFATPVTVWRAVQRLLPAGAAERRTAEPVLPGAN